MVFDKVKLSNNKKQVSFALPNERRKKSQQLRLKSPAARKDTNQGADENKNIDTDAPSKHNRRNNNKQTVKKCFVRDSELPVSSSTKNVWPARTINRPTRHGSILKNPLHPDQSISDSTYLHGCASKYSAPELYSSLLVAQKIKSAAEEHGKHLSITDVPLLIKHQIEGKASIKNNIPFEEQIFHDLVTLNVSECDEQILGKDPEKFVPEDREPSLADFHQLKSGAEYRHECKPLPCKVEKVRRYNGLSVFNKMQSWENSP